MSDIYLAEPSVMSERIDISRTDDYAEQRYDAVQDADNWWQTTVAWYGEGPNCGVIEYLEDGYDVLQPIPYEIDEINAGDFLASFEEANIAIGGSDPGDAYQALLAEILDTFDALVAEPNLSANAAEQLRILRTYIGKT
jgi:hypothetical protein